MTKNFNSIKELMTYLQSQIPNNLEVIGENIRNKLRENVQELWYDRPFTPTHYNRTMEYINSLVCSKAVSTGGGIYEVEIYFDTNKINPYSSTNGNWPQHESVFGDDVSDYIPQWIEDGNNNSRLYSYEGVHPVKITKQWIDEIDYVRKKMIELLSHNGFNCSII